jgi:OOP family OmpA-OmpF porin
MHLRHLALFTALPAALFAGSVSAQVPSYVYAPSPSPFYVGGSVGGSDFRGDCPSVFNSCDRKDTGWKIFGGMQFSPWFGVETAYVDLGKIKTDAGDAKVHGVPIDLVGSIPFTGFPQLVPFAKLGTVYTHSDVSGIPNAGNSSNGWDWTYGVGLKYYITPPLAIRGEWERFRTKGILGNTNDDVDLWSVGLEWHF